MRKRFVSIISVLLLCTLFVTSVSAIDTSSSERIVASTRIELENGCYVVEEITENAALIQTRATSSKTGSKTSTYYDGNNTKLFAVKVTGSFSYTGSSSWANSSAATVSIYDSSVSYVSKSASYSGNTATATGKVWSSPVYLSRTVNLSCDQNGNLS